MDTVEKIESWDIFWQLFNGLCEALSSRKQLILVDKLNDAKSWVQNSRDEWFEFSYSLDFLIDNDSSLFNKNENQNLIKLQNYLNDFLYSV